MYAVGVLARERLKQLIDERVGGNQSELARRIGEHPNWVNYRITGTTQIKADELPRLAEGLGCSPCLFFEDTGSPAIDDLAVRRKLRQLRAELDDILTTMEAPDPEEAATLERLEREVAEETDRLPQ